MSLHIDVITDIGKALRAMGIKIYKIHREVIDSQIEIVLKYEPILEAVDKFILARHVIKTCCRNRGFVACFIP